MIDVNKHLDDAIKRYQQAKQEIVHDSIYLLCTLVRDEFPQAKTINFEWSDQGGWLTLNHYDDFEDFEDFDDDSLTSNLDDTCEGIWGTYMTAESNGHYVMDIDAALSKSALAIDGPPSDPDRIEEFLGS